MAACLGSGLAVQADAKRPPACSSLRQDVWHTVFRTVRVGDEVKAWAHDALDPDDGIGSDVVTGFSRGTLVFKGDGAKYRAQYHGGAC